MASDNVRQVLAIGIMRSVMEEGFAVFPGREFQQEGFTRLVIKYDNCPESLNGKWMRIATEKNYLCTKLNPVTIIYDPEPTRYVDGVIVPQVKTRHLRFKEVKNNIMYFTHPFFGCVQGDLHRGISERKMKTARKHWIQALLMGDHIVWKIAEERYQDYFGQAIDTTSEPSGYWTEGLVTKKFGNIYHVWAGTSADNVVCLDQKYCPSNFEMVGRHISMYVDWRYQVRRTVKIVQAGWETRIKDGETEVEICFQYNETEDDGETMVLEHDTYGTIVIKRSMLPDCYINNPKNSWYIGWARYAPNYKSEVWFEMSSVSEMHGPFDYQPAATILTKSVSEDLDEIAEMRRTLARTMEKISVMFRRKEVVEVLQKTCMDDYIELLGHTIKHEGS